MLLPNKKKLRFRGAWPLMIGYQRRLSLVATPYADLPDHRFWRKAVAEPPPSAVDPILDLPFQIHPEDKVATGGSCFAQHIAKRLQSSGLQYYQPERAPAGVSDAEASARGYGVFSCRYGNIYTTRQLLQLFDRAFGFFNPVLDWWLRPDGRYVDPFRPRVEPDGFLTIEELQGDRKGHLAAVRTMFETMDVFLFTFGLTESWVHKEDGAVLQLAPGVAGGEWDQSKYEFWNARVNEVASDYLAFVDKLKAVNPSVRLIISVSPVPIIATYMPRHALVSNSASKSILRAASDEVVAARPEIAYFPSYDLVTFGPNAARYYKDNLRELNDVGLHAVMGTFFNHFTAKKAPAGREDRGRRSCSTTPTRGEKYHVFPTRLWHIYSPRQLSQLFDRAYGLFWPKSATLVDRAGHFIDPFRSWLEKTSFPTETELDSDRDAHFSAARTLFETSETLIFSFELASGWEDPSDGAVFSSPPSAESMEAPSCCFRTFSEGEIEEDVETFLAKLRKINPDVHVIFAIAPCALHQPSEQADTSGKIALRNAIRRTADRTKNTTYFPTYEIATGPGSSAPTGADGSSDEWIAGLSDAVLSLSSNPKHGGQDGSSRASGKQATAGGFDANASVSHLQTVICDEVAIEQSLQP